MITHLLLIGNYGLVVAVLAIYALCETCLHFECSFTHLALQNHKPLASHLSRVPRWRFRRDKQIWCVSLLAFSHPLLKEPSIAPEPMQVGDHVVTQKSLYTGLFVIGLPLLWWSSPIGTFFWLVGASSVLILGHATLIEPGIESEYATVQDAV